MKKNRSFVVTEFVKICDELLVNYLINKKILKEAVCSFNGKLLADIFISFSVKLCGSLSSTPPQWSQTHRKPRKASTTLQYCYQGRVVITTQCTMQPFHAKEVCVSFDLGRQCKVALDVLQFCFVQSTKLERKSPLQKWWINIF